MNYIGRPRLLLDRVQLKMKNIIQDTILTASALSRSGFGEKNQTVARLMWKSPHSCLWKSIDVQKELATSISIVRIRHGASGRKCLNTQKLEI